MRHHADAAGAADAIVEPGEIDGSQPAAGEAATADAGRIDVVSRAEIIECRWSSAMKTPGQVVPAQNRLLDIKSSWSAAKSVDRP